MGADGHLAGDAGRLLAIRRHLLATRRHRFVVHQNGLLFVAIVILIVAIPGHVIHAECRCRHVTGGLVSQLLTGQECHSPVQLCTSGRFFGDINASFVFTATSMTASADTPITGVNLYTGDMLITTAQGNVFLKESGAFNAVPNGTGDVGAVSVIVGGSGVHERVWGQLRIAGTFTPQAGGHSQYDGQICH